jgi:hypothetical protein
LPRRRTPPEPKNTLLTYTSPQQTTFYFRRTFSFTGNPANTTLAAHLIIDDGAVVYLNGVEVLRLGMPDGPITYDTFRQSHRRQRGLRRTLHPFQPAQLVQGNNVIAVEVHQINATSSDIVFGLALEAAPTPAPPTPRCPQLNPRQPASILPSSGSTKSSPINDTGIPGPLR